MIWVVALVGVIAMVFLFGRKRSAISGRVGFDNQRDRMRLMPVDEQIKLAIECRGAALEGYYRGFESAKSGDKNDYFCHQVGILEAARSVLVPNKENRDNDQITRALQMETVPFNKPDAELAQRAFVEYLVWRFFPDQADVTPIQEVMRQFVGEIYETDVGDSDDKNFRYEALYSNQYDWQEFAVTAAKERIGTR